MSTFPGKLAIQQRVLPSYRVSFFESLADRCEGGLSVFVGLPEANEAIHTSNELTKAELQRTSNIYLANPSSTLFLCWQKGIMDWLENCDPDSLVIEANPRYISSYLAIYWMRKAGKPVLGWGLGVPRTSVWLESFLRRKFLETLDGIIAYSNRGVKEYQQLGMDNVFLAYNTTSPKPNWDNPYRSLQINGPLKVLFVGRLQARKRIDLLLEACHELPENLQPELWIVGDGPVSDELKKMAKERYPRTVFTGAVYGESLADYFLSSDLFVLPGTGGLAVQEAMAYGLPVIVAKGDGTQDDLVTRKNGWQIPSGDLDALIEAMVDALSDIPGLRQKGAESYRIVAEKINLQTMVDQFINAIKKRYDHGKFA